MKSGIKLNLLILLAICCASAVMAAAAELIEKAARFTTVRRGSAVAPKEFLAEPGVSERGCGFACCITTDCFGFCWLLGECRLFDLPAFLNASTWVGSGTKSDVFVRDYFQRLLAINCSQSSTYDMQHCRKAIDGDTADRACTHTDNSTNEWWEAALAAPSHVTFVTIYNRQDCCAERLNNFDILVDGSVCNQVRLSAPFSVANFTCNAFGSRIRVVNSQNQYLTICEFMAYGL